MRKKEEKNAIIEITEHHMEDCVIIGTHTPPAEGLACPNGSSNESHAEPI